MGIREYKTYNEMEILSLYASVGWTAYTDRPEVLPSNITANSSKVGRFFHRIQESIADGTESKLCSAHV